MLVIPPPPRINVASNTRPWRNNFNDFQFFFSDKGQINRVPSVKYLGVVVDDMEMEDAYQ